MHPSDLEIVIMRNTCVSRLYDVVRVDYFSEEVEFIAKGLEFEEAIGLKLELEETN